MSDVEEGDQSRRCSPILKGDAAAVDGRSAKAWRATRLETSSLVLSLRHVTQDLPCMGRANIRQPRLLPTRFGEEGASLLPEVKRVDGR